MTLYELLTGGLPYEGDSIYEIYNNIKNKEPIRPRVRWNGIPRDLETIISTAISKDPQLRYKSMADFQNDLDNFLNYKPINAKSPSSIQRVFYFLRRKKASLGLITIGLLLISGLVFMTIDKFKKNAEENIECTQGECFNRALGVSYRIPPSWKAQKPEVVNNTRLFYYVPPTEQTITPSSPSLNFFILRGVHNQTEILQAEIAFFRDHSMGLIENHKIILSNDASLQSYYAESDILLSGKLRLKEHVIFKNGDAYVLAGTAAMALFNQYKKDFDDSLLSLRFLK